MSIAQNMALVGKDLENNKFQSSQHENLFMRRLVLSYHHKLDNTNEAHGYSKLLHIRHICRIIIKCKFKILFNAQHYLVFINTFQERINNSILLKEHNRHHYIKIETRIHGDDFCTHLHENKTTTNTLA